MRRKTLSWQEMDKKHISLEILVGEYLTTCKLEGKDPEKPFMGIERSSRASCETAGGNPGGVQPTACQKATSPSSRPRSAIPTTPPCLPTRKHVSAHDGA